MATSGTFVTFDITMITEEAYERIGSDIQAINAGHMRTARRSLQFAFSNWINTGARVWTLDEETYTTVADTDSFNVTANTVDVLDATITYQGADVPLTKIAREDYQTIPNKDEDGKPDRFWCDRSSEPYTITLYPVPDSALYTIKYWRIRRLYDPTAGQQTPDVPFRWVDALTSELALRLFDKQTADWRLKYKSLRPDLEDAAARTFKLASDADRDRASTFIVPDIYD